MPNYYQPEIETASREEIIKIQNNKVIKVHVNCEYGDYQVVEDVRQILGDKFVEDNGDAE